MSHAGSHIMMLYHMLAHTSWYFVTCWLTHHDVISHAGSYIMMLYHMLAHTSWYFVTCWLTHHDVISHAGSYIMMLYHMLAHTSWYFMSLQVKTVFNTPKFAAHLRCASRYQFLLSIKHWSKKAEAEWLSYLQRRGCCVRHGKLWVWAPNLGRFFIGCT